MKRQLYPNSEYCDGNLIIIDFIHFIVPGICVHKRGIRKLLYRCVSVHLIERTYKMRPCSRIYYSNVS